MDVKTMLMAGCIALLLSAMLMIPSQQPTFAQTEIPTLNPALNLNTISITLCGPQKLRQPGNSSL